MESFSSTAKDAAPTKIIIVKQGFTTKNISKHTSLMRFPHSLTCILTA